MKKTLFCMLACMMAVSAWSADVLVLRFKDGSYVCWQGKLLPTVTAGRDSVSVSAGAQTVCYASRSVETFYVDDEELVPVESVAEDAPQAITVQGRRVLFEGAGSLYTLDGKLVARGTGSVTAPKGGIYVLQTSKKTLKLLLP